MAALSSSLQRFREVLPRGGQLPAEEWARRHRALTGVLWAMAAILGVVTVVLGYPISHTFLHVGPLVAAGIVAHSGRFSRQLRSLACAFGMLTVAALGVHLAEGRIEAHFSFFVLVVLLTLYEDWLVFALAVGYVLLHHGGLGMIDPKEVFHDQDQFENPWGWAAIHAVFVAATSVAGV